MRNTLLLCAALLLASCASNQPPPSLPASRPVPEAVSNPPTAWEEGSLRSGLQALQDETLSDLRKSFEGLQADLEGELRALLARARASGRPSAPAAPGR